MSTKKPALRPKDDLCGKCFVIYGDDGLVQYQGVILAALIDGHYLVQFFDWIMGAPSTCAIYHVTAMRSDKGRNPRKEPGAWEFFMNDEHLRDWLENGPGQHLTHR